MQASSPEVMANIIAELQSLRAPRCRAGTNLMPVTPERAQFIRQEFRSVTANSPTIDAAYGDKARKTKEPIETFFEVEADAQSMCTERMSLLGAKRRRMSQNVAGESVAMGLTYTGGVPTVTVIDDDRQISGPFLVSELNMNFAADESLIETWGDF